MADKPDGKRSILKAMAIILTVAAIWASPLILFVPVLLSAPSERLSIMTIGGLVAIAIVSTSGLLAIALSLWKVASHQP